MVIRVSLGALVWLAATSSAAAPARERISSSPLKPSSEKSLPAWLMISFEHKTPIQQIYKASIAQGVWAKSKVKGDESFTPLVQFFVRPEPGGNFAKQAQAWTGEILENLGIPKLGPKSPTIRVKSASLNLPKSAGRAGSVSEYQSVQNGHILITCVAFVKAQSKVVALYTQATKSSMPNGRCSGILNSLAGFNHLDRAFLAAPRKLLPSSAASRNFKGTFNRAARG